MREKSMSKGGISLKIIVLSVFPRNFHIKFDMNTKSEMIKQDILMKCYTMRDIYFF
jgi:hypothetical protein